MYGCAVSRDGGACWRGESTLELLYACGCAVSREGGACCLGDSITLYAWDILRGDVMVAPGLLYVLLLLLKLVLMLEESLLLSGTCLGCTLPLLITLGR